MYLDYGCMEMLNIENQINWAHMKSCVASDTLGGIWLCWEMYAHRNNSSALAHILLPYFNKKLSEELIAYVPLIQQGPHRKRRLQQFLRSCYYSNDRGIHRQTHRLSSDNRLIIIENISI
jgi:hypothetical protein